MIKTRATRVSRRETPVQRRWGVVIAVHVLVLLTSVAALADESFEEKLARVDKGLRKNPSHVPTEMLESCLSRRNVAVRLFELGQETRAERALNFCFKALRIPSRPPPKKKVKAPTMQELQERAAREIEAALALTPNVDNGLEIYRTCAMCHEPEGSGLHNGSVPQIAGQHRTVVIKQLADIRAGNRDSVLMIPYATVESIGGPQAIADVAAYIDTLEISTDTDKGAGDDLELGRQVYVENCARCHGAQGEGDPENYVPRIQAQHYNYLMRQYEWIRSGKRRNGNAEMIAQIEDLEDREIRAVLDYVSRLEPPAELQAPPGWQNPDFAGQRPFASTDD